MIASKQTVTARAVRHAAQPCTENFLFLSNLIALLVVAAHGGSHDTCNRSVELDIIVLFEQ